MRKIGVLLGFTVFLIIMLPGLITLLFGTDAEYTLSAPIAGVSRDSGESDEIAVFNPQVTQSTHGSGAVGEIVFEDYIAGVVAAEMPSEYEPEALKAQAVAARTYAYRRLAGETDFTDTATLAQADISGISQAYLSVAELRAKWGDSFESRYAKITEAVRGTRGEIMMYDDEPIEAVFHSSSAGMTENAENVWNKVYPYLKSVPSGEEEELNEKSFSSEELISLFEESFGELGLSDGSFLEQFDIISRTDAGYVLAARVGEATLTGAQIRSALGLKSSAFTIRSEGDSVIFTSSGYGHGVGMSQRGAQFMAESGYNYREILSYYYQDISIVSIY